MFRLKFCVRSITRKLFSTQRAKLVTVEPLTVENNYSKKIASKEIKNQDDVKPEDWDDAKPFEDIPGPKPLPVIGNTWRFLPGIGEYYGLDLVNLVYRFKEQFGDIVCLGGIPGRRPMILTYNPDDCEKMFRNEGPWPIRNFLKSIIYYRTKLKRDVYQGSAGILGEQGENWFKIRSVVNKILMQPRTAEMYVHSIDEITNQLLENMRYFAKTGHTNEMPEDFQNVLYKWGMECAGVITYNKRLGVLSRNPNEEAQHFIDCLTEIFDILYRLDFLPSLGFFHRKDWKRFVYISDYHVQVTQKYIKECLSEADPDPNIPDYERSVLERLLKKDKLIALMISTDILAGGIDTTGKSFSTALYHLAQNPSKQQKLREELKKWMPNKNSPVTKDMLRETLYLKAAIKESMRMAPIAAGNLRTTVKDLVLSGYRIPKGTDVFTGNIAMSLDEKHYIEPSKFIPERWLRTTQDEYSYKNVHQFVTLPFGFGPRACIGKRLASMELEVGLSKIVRNFVISWRYPDAKFAARINNGIVDPLRFHVEEVDN